MDSAKHRNLFQNKLEMNGANQPRILFISHILLSPQLVLTEKRPKSHWKTDTTTGSLHYLYLWVILDVTEYHILHNYDIAQSYSMFYPHRSVLTLPALFKLVLRNWFLRNIPQKGHLYRDKWETSSEKRNTYQLDGKSYLSRVLLLQVDTNQWKSKIDFNQYYQ